MSITQPNTFVAERQEQSALVQWWDLFQMELTNWRWSWRISLLQGTIAPLFSLLALGRLRARLWR